METIAKKLREYHKSRKYSYCSTVSGGDKAKVYLLDATLARLNKDRKIIKKNRNVYYFQTNRNYGLKSIFKKWKPWKIYLVSEVKIEA